MQKRKFSREFKIEAVRLVREWGVSVALVVVQIRRLAPASTGHRFAKNVVADVNVPRRLRRGGYWAVSLTQEDGAISAKSKAGRGHAGNYTHVSIKAINARAVFLLP